MPNWFVAFPIDAGDWFARLPSPPPGTRCFAPEDLHLTIAFLGAVDASRAHAAFAALGREASPACDLVRGRVVPMGASRRPSALSALAELADPADGSLAARLVPVRDAILEAAALPGEGRDPLPHVTLARVTRRARAAERRAALDWVRSCDLRSAIVRVDRVALYTRAADRTARLFDRADERELIVEARP
jgi:2'-5' RNA ligase